MGRAPSTAQPTPSRMASPHVLFVEPEIAGHQRGYIRLIGAGLRSREWGLRATFLVHPEFPSEDRDPDRADHYVRITPGEFRLWVERPLWLQSFRRLAIARRYALRLGVDHVHFMNLDHMQLALALLGKPGDDVTWSGTLFRPFVHYPGLGLPGGRTRDLLRRARQSVLLRLMLRRFELRHMFTLDPFFPDFAAERWGDQGRKVLELPDPVMYPAGKVDRVLPEGYLPSGKQVFVLFGALARRKGVVQTLKALELVDPRTASEIAVILAGSVQQDVKSELFEAVAHVRAARPEIDLRLDDRRLSDAELADLVARSDVVLAPYQRFVGSSGVLLWAAAAGKPVLTQEYGAAGKIAQEFGLGLTVDTEDPQAIAEGIARLTERESVVRPDARARYVERHAPQAYWGTLLRTLSGALSGSS